MSRIDDIRVEIEKIEEAYEFMLAYAAQGRSDEGAGPDGAQIRILISQFSAAVGIIDRAVSIIPPDLPVAVAFIDQFKSDSATMTSVLAILLNSKNISSEMVDNTNGLISVRAYLTSLFFLDKAVLN